ncbi:MULTISPECIES: aminomethyl-transferring glycine dehydrogenase subunit GcvPB [Sphingobium]|jgi:glycine dehydrogenase subunit 2|uniref:aminomethyl-transferring glycine dehydrogenase subunit GcvPB n=1 Tax=Sphingobium TaxID=165695 RepID=UPI000DBB1BBC|nr:MULTISPECIES: aminomethyl-transferring glycine dehydrogenase subunit GcvPB [Sphingobium]KAA9015150.1 glycine dehydrogenase subunit 2 [Sphingobium limneticum]MBU0930639.1 aminomethyl-transferring glycine dehydrogenase subunit GcvPB [Alphaproteobacteria bacterium]BBD00449.1 glycine dehydrogenase subunit 2 [Sphingobium sp. YG1]
MSMLKEGRPTTPVPVKEAHMAPQTATGNRALMLEEALIFEIGSTDTTGVDFAAAPQVVSRLGSLARTDSIGLPGLSEQETVRHYTRLSRQNYAIDLGLFPLGSCTMKHNPRLNEKVARMPGFADIHPLQPQSTVQGALAVIHELAAWLVTLTGMHSVAMSPKAGAHGELCGLLAIRAALEARGDARSVVLVPESAHGTNPATAAFCGYKVEDIPATAEGRVDLEALKARLGPDVAAVMITNPNTCGLFERDMKTISDAVHAAGAFVYCDGANFNAIVGRVRPGDLGVDAMHINLHKTFSTPHGGGGPGSGPVVLSEALTPFAPLPFVEKQGDSFALVEEETAEDHHAQTFGRMVAFHGQMGMFTRALTYILSHGADGLRQVANDAVLNANYILRSLDDVLDAPFGGSGPCMHEALFSDKGLAEGFTTLDIAKGLIDEGFHPMTMYFPLVVHGAMLVEPTETESKAALDQFILALRSLAERAKAGDEALKGAPYHAPRRRLDETLAARKPILTWTDPALAIAAE